MKYEPGSKPVRRTVGDVMKLKIVGEGGGRILRSHDAFIAIFDVLDRSNDKMLWLNRSEAVALRDALNRIIGTES